MHNWKYFISPHTNNQNQARTTSLYNLTLHCCSSLHPFPHPSLLMTFHILSPCITVSCAWTMFPATNHISYLRPSFQNLLKCHFTLSEVAVTQLFFLVSSFHSQHIFPVVLLIVLTVCCHFLETRRSHGQDMNISTAGAQSASSPT